MQSKTWCCVASCNGNRNVIRTKDAKTGDPLEISVCLDCGLVQQSEFPSGPSLRQYYSHHYREDYKGSYTPRPKHVIRAAIVARDRLDFLTSYFKTKNLPLPKTLLDIGAGGGEVVYSAKCLGISATGIEPNIGYSEFARHAYGVQIDTQQIDQVVAKRAEIVTLFHVLEHVPDPVAVMAKLFQIVKEGGWLYIEVPNIEQYDASPSNIFFKAHLIYFSEATLISIASPYFEPVSIDSRGNLRILFKRRDSSVPATPIRRERIQQTLNRIAQKGWIEYLTKGGGLFKPARRIRQYWLEFKLRRLAPREIVERMLAVSGSAKH